MKSCILIAALCASPLTPPTVAAQPAAQPITKASATVELVPGTSAVSVRITNLSKSPLEAWQLRVEHQANGVSQETSLLVDTYLSIPQPAPGRGPIPPGGSRDQVVALSRVPAGARAELTMLLFADLTSEGSSEAVAQILRRRDDDAETFRTWIDALEAALAQAPAQARSALAKVLEAERRRTSVRSTDATARAVQANVEALINSFDGDPEFTTRLTQLTDAMRQQRDLAERHHVRQPEVLRVPASEGKLGP